MHGNIIGDIGMNSTWFRNLEYVMERKRVLGTKRRLRVYSKKVEIVRLLICSYTRVVERNLVAL